MKNQTVTQIAEDAKTASLILAGLTTEIKNQALMSMAEILEENASKILEENSKDMEYAKIENISAPLAARLALNEDKVKCMAKGIRSVVTLPDPVGQKTLAMEMDSNLKLYRVSCPIGVIGAIFESRPDAVPQISSLCLKSGNAVVLKGGSEAQNSNRIIVGLIQEAIKNVPKLPQTAVQMIETRSEVADMLKEEANIQLIVPRGSNEFVRYIQEHTKIPVLGHSEGICHGYIDDQADINKSLAVVIDSKLQYPAACNAMETLLVHEAIAPSVLPGLVKKFWEKGVNLVGCDRACKISPQIQAAQLEDWDTEYSDLKISIKIVSNLNEAITHINFHGSGHTDTILTENQKNAKRFLNEVDSASVMVNASTRFADGYRFGLGAEIGISTNKTHARGPVGLEGLVIYKYKVIGDGQTVAQYSGERAGIFYIGEWTDLFKFVFFP